MKTGRKLIACTLAVTMIAASACAAYADSSAGSGKSAGGKEEVVYIMTDAAGNVEDGEVVNIFGSGSITDYGDYSDVKILNTSDKIKQSGTAELAEKYEMFDTGVSEAADKVNVLAGGVSRLSTGISTLTSKYSEFDEGLASYAEGTQELYTNTSGLDSQVQEKIDSILDSLSGGDDEAESFVSEKNTDVKSVQFVIKTSAIEKADKADVKDTAEKDKSFLEKVKALFEK